MDVLLMLRGETRHCSDCGTPTIFLPVEDHGWICTSCDAAVVLVDPAHVYVSTAA
jgi:hypothetical protein